MSSTLTDELLERARILSHEERVHLAYLLLHDDEETEDAWWASIGPELDAISAALDSGQMGTVPLAEVQRLMRRASR
jgi:hypothetical protein